MCELAGVENMSKTFVENMATMTEWPSIVDKSLNLNWWNNLNPSFSLYKTDQRREIAGVLVHIKEGANRGVLLYDINLGLVKQKYTKKNECAIKAYIQTHIQT